MLHVTQDVHSGGERLLALLTVHPVDEVGRVVLVCQFVSQNQATLDALLHLRVHVRHIAHQIADVEFLLVDVGRICATGQASLFEEG